MHPCSPADPLPALLMNNKANNLSASQTPNKPSKANQTEPNREANRAANAEQTTQFQCSPLLGHGMEREEEGEGGWCCANNTKSDLSVDQLTLRVIKTTTRRLRFSLRCHLQLPFTLPFSLSHTSAGSRCVCVTCVLMKY